ncbi:MAG TPA: choice-of-anchor V domain-containing protein [Candidatus Kapabacteria bacterium]|jgi:hypothetical protein
MTFRTFSRTIKLGFVLKLGFVFVPLLIVGGYAIHEAAAEPAGIGGQAKIGCGGDGCHGAQSSQTVVKIWSDSSVILAGQPYTFHISVASTNSKAFGAGCDLTPDVGQVNPLPKDQLGHPTYPPSIKGFPNDLSHTTPQIFKNDSAEWKFQYVAPATGGVAHIFAAGNAVNSNGNADDGDHWNLTVDTFNIVTSAVTPVPVSSPSISLFPNPSKGTITLSDDALSGVADVTVTDAAGRSVLRETVVTGEETPLDVSGLPKGSYFLTVRPQHGDAIMKSFVIAK